MTTEEQQLIELQNLQQQFLTEMQGYPSHLCAATVMSVFESFFAYLEVKGENRRGRDLDFYLDELMKHMKQSLKERIIEGDVGI